jgi:phosphomannomutase
VAITASHNPPEWNALKFVGPDGLFLSADRGRELLDIYHQGDYTKVADAMRQVCPCRMRSTRTRRGPRRARAAAETPSVQRRADS